MSKLASFRRIRTSDFGQEDQPLVEGIADPINSGFDQLFYCLNGRVDFENNIAATVREVDVQVNAQGIPITQTTFSLSRPGIVTGTIITRTTNLTNSTGYPTGAPHISYTQLENSVLINHITGLQPNQLYRLRIIALN